MWGAFEVDLCFKTGTALHCIAIDIHCKIEIKLTKGFMPLCKALQWCNCLITTSILSPTFVFLYPFHLNDQKKSPQNKQVVSDQVRYVTVLLEESDKCWDSRGEGSTCWWYQEWVRARALLLAVVWSYLNLYFSWFMWCLHFMCYTQIPVNFLTHPSVHS